MPYGQINMRRNKRNYKKNLSKKEEKNKNWRRSQEKRNEWGRWRRNPKWRQNEAKNDESEEKKKEKFYGNLNIQGRVWSRPEDDRDD